MNTGFLNSEELRNVRGGDDSGSDLSNTVQAPTTDPDVEIVPKAGSDLSNTVQ